MRLTRRAAIAGLALSGCAAAASARLPLIFRTEDEVPVSGLAYGEGRRAVLLVREGTRGRTWDAQARRLAGAGFRVLAMDYRGRGPAPDVAPDDSKTHLDVLAAVRQLRAEGAQRVAVVGASWGGWAAGTAAISAPGLIERLILLAHSPFDHPERLQGRKLFITARDDRDGGGRARLESIREQYARASEPKELVVLDGAAHAQLLFLTPAGAQLQAEIERFLSAP